MGVTQCTCDFAGELGLSAAVDDKVLNALGLFLLLMRPIRFFRNTEASLEVFDELDIGLSRPVLVVKNFLNKVEIRDLVVLAGDVDSESTFLTNNFLALNSHLNYSP